MKPGCTLLTSPTKRILCVNGITPNSSPSQTIQTLALPITSVASATWTVSSAQSPNAVLQPQLFHMDNSELIMVFGLQTQNQIYKWDEATSSFVDTGNVLTNSGRGGFGVAISSKYLLGCWP